MTTVEEIHEKARIKRSERYLLQSIARKAIPDERVALCLRRRIQKQGNDFFEDVKVWQHATTKKAFYSGLIVCGSVWTCPVCASKVSERRKQELKQAFDMHIASGGHFAFLTLTFKHTRQDKLKNIVDQFTKALEKFRSGKRYDKIRKQMGMIGSIRSFEVTYSHRNGFHPHVHIAIFHEHAVTLSDIESEMRELWVKACNKFGLEVKEDIGLTLKYGKTFSDYLSKSGWGVESEMTKSHVKKGKFESLQMFELLREYYLTENDIYLGLYREYAIAFKRKRQLQWSNGLKARFIIEDKTDEQVATEKVEDADILGLVEFEDWKRILRYNLRSDLLDNVEKSGFELGLRKTLAKAIKKETSWHEVSSVKK